MTVSMTGFAARRGQGAGHSWAWDIRSVNGKGLDLRLRVPDWIDGLEQALRAVESKLAHLEARPSAPAETPVAKAISPVAPAVPRLRRCGFRRPPRARARRLDRGACCE